MERVGGLGITEMGRRMIFHELAYKDWKEAIFGFAKNKLRYGFGLEVGNGKVIPEIKYTLKPGMEKNLDSLMKEYDEALHSVMDRAINLGIESLQVDLEFTEPMTIQPRWGYEVVVAHKELMEKYNSEYGLKCGLRATVADIRRFSHGLRKGKYWDLMMESFEMAVEAGADLISIESRGGQEVFSYSLIRNDMLGILFSLGILSPLDVEYLWRNIVDIAGNKSIPAGDTGCAFANSAMILANGLVNRKISHVLSAVIRAMTAVRTLIPFELGALGPGKDCAYENVIIKMITGCPIAMEGKTAAIAHSSLVGNIAAAICDLWSNETVILDTVFGGKTPAVILEMLSYDAKLMNKAIENNQGIILRDLLIESDKFLDPQALIISPESAYRIAKAIITEKDTYFRVLAAAREAVSIIEENKDKLGLSNIEIRYLTTIKNAISNMQNKDMVIEEGINKFKQRIPAFDPKINYEL